MAISVGDSFSRATAQPRFADEVVADITARDAIPVPIRYLGMKVVVLDDGTGEVKTFILKTGTANVDWVDDTGGGGGGLSRKIVSLIVNASPSDIGAAFIDEGSDYQIYIDVQDPLGVEMANIPFDNTNLVFGNRITVTNISANPLYFKGRSVDASSAILGAPLTLGEYQSVTYEYMSFDGVSSNPLYVMISKSN